MPRLNLVESYAQGIVPEFAKQGYQNMRIMVPGLGLVILNCNTSTRSVDFVVNNDSWGVRPSASNANMIEFFNSSEGLIELPLDANNAVYSIPSPFTVGFAALYAWKMYISHPSNSNLRK